MKRYTLNELEALPTLRVGHFDDLKVETPDTRVWLSRMTKADGADYDNAVTVDKLRKGCWVTIEEYEAQPEPNGPYAPKTGERCNCRPGVWRDNCPNCEGTGWVIDFKAIRERNASCK